MVWKHFVSPIPKHRLFGSSLCFFDFLPAAQRLSLIVTSSTIDIFFEITNFSKILSKFTYFSNILSKFDNIFEIFRKKCKFRKYFRKFCNFEKSVMVDEVNTSPSLQLQTYVNTKDIYVIYLQCQSKFLVIILKYNDLIASLKSICV